jgi:crotonobetainyl-CoA hydratase/dehydration protein DpgD
LDRPQVLNAMDLAMHTELAAIWDDFEADDDLWVAVLTGAGDRAFSVGQDLKELAARNTAQTPPPSTFGSRGKPGWPRLTERFTLTKPIIARVNGYALGGGFELALACDVIVAAEHATFGLPEARLGLIPGAGGIFRLMRQLPQRRALGLLLTGRRIPAAEAWLKDILSCAPLAVRATKEAALASVDLPLEDAFAATYAWERRRMQSEDAIEGPRAFTAGREPVWRNR